MENLTSFASSRGLLKSCRSRNRSPASSSFDLDQDLVRNHAPGQSIYVCTEALEVFCADVLPLVEAPFVLVTGDSDRPVDQRLLAEEHVDHMLASDLLIGWFAQNLTSSHEKIESLPIGLDYHTMWEKPGLWGLTGISPLAQEYLLMSAIKASPAPQERYVTCYCNWHFSLNSEDRRDCLESIDKSLCFFEPRKTTRAASWSRQAECAFVVSPRGWGLDCHRTWEALLLGAIPIVKSSPLDGLFSGLPVLIVSEWGEIRKELLIQFLQKALTQKYDFSSLFREYWASRFRGEELQFLESMTMAQFRRTLTRLTG